MSQTATVERIPGPGSDDAMDALLAIADRIVEAARNKGADAAEAFVQTTSGRSISIEKNQVGFTSGGGDGGIGLRVIKAGRTGFAYFSDPMARDASIESALAVASRAKQSKFAFPAPSKLPTVDGLWDDAVASFDTDMGLSKVHDLIAGAQEVDKNVNVSGGSVGIGMGATALVNSEGVQCAERGTGVGLSAYVVLKRGDTVTTGFEGHQANTMDARIGDALAIGRIAAEMAVKGQDAQPFGDGRATTVVFHPDAGSAFLEFITIPALHGDKAARGESLFSGKLGEVVTDPRLMITDDPTRAHGLGSGAWDDEGLASRPVPLIEAGRVANYLYDIGGALEYGGGPQAATASALRSGGMSDDRTYQEMPSVGARNVHVATTDAKPLDQLIAGIDDGILVRDVLGAHTANSTSGDFSVSSTVLFRIKDGALAGALESVMLAGNLPDLLRDHLVGASTDMERTSGHFSPVGLEMPHLALSSVHVVGG